LQAQRVHHGGQHSHIISLGAIHAAGGPGHAAKDVAAADHEAHLHPHVHDIADILGDSRQRLRIQPIVSTAHQSLAGDLEQDALICRLGWHLILSMVGLACCAGGSAAAG
jgi:hypothetical protein